MNVVVVGSGAREHALCASIAEAGHEVFCAPGNAGTAADGENVNLAPSDFAGLVRFVKDNQVALTVVGPEAPLAAGIVDVFEREKLRVFGPSKAAAELEASKGFCKDLLRNAAVPSGDYHTFRDAEGAIRFLQEREDVPIVVKADGLAAGKGVFVCDRRGIEERLHGQEARVLAITDGQTLVTLPPAQDHKRAYDGDAGPNTGGMGAYSPAPLVDEPMLHWVEEHIFVPTVHAMKRARRPFRGVLYAGLMITNQGPKVLEYNVRFGDPECQPILLRLKSDLVDVLEATADGSLDRLGPLEWDPRPAVCVVMASEGYPGDYAKGHPIRGLAEAAQVPDVKVFHAGTTLKNGQVVTSGGRVLGVTALGNSIPLAKLQAYTAVKRIRWDGAWCRKDISDKAVP